MLFNYFFRFAFFASRVGECPLYIINISKYPREQQLYGMKKTTRANRSPRDKHTYSKRKYRKRLCNNFFYFPCPSTFTPIIKLARLLFAHKIGIVHKLVITFKILYFQITIRFYDL